MLTLKPVVTALAACAIVAGPLSLSAMADHKSYNGMTIGITDVKGDDDSVSEAIYDAFRNKVIAMHRFTVLERDDARMEQVIREAAFGASGLVDKSSAPKLGQMLGAGYLAFIDYRNLTVTFEKPSKKGETGTYRASLKATARFVNTETGVALNAFSTSGSGSDKNRRTAVNEAVEDVVNNMLLSTREVFALRGAIISRDGKEIATDLGAQHGLADNSYFNVTRMGSNGVRKKIGLVRMEEIGDSQSEGVIREGFHTIKVGDQLEENVRYSRPYGIGAFYEFVSMETKNSSFGANSGNFPTFASGNLVGLTLNGPELFGDSAGLAFSGGYLAPGGKGLSGFVFDLTGHYRLDLIPDWLALDFRLGPTLGTLGQDRANFDQSASLAFKSSDTPGNITFGGAAGLKGILMLGRNFRVQAGVGYRYLAPVNTWTGGSTKDETAFSINEPNSIAYPSVGINGVSFTGGIEGQF
ncbi:MAG: hypothetical protein H7338_01215 [Candidatus Sericytochromatia bacterium]|nr:hypothetical protein [Candidatus Sericytochromatia bacterium]